VVHFLLVRLQHDGVVDRFVRSVDRELAGIDERPADLVEGGLGGLHQRDADLRVLNRLIEACSLCPQAF